MYEKGGRRGVGRKAGGKEETDEGEREKKRR